MQAILLFAVLVTTALGHLFPHLGRGNAHSSGLSQRTLSSVKIAGGGGAWACNADRILEIQDIIAEFRTMVQNAIDVLSKEGAENSVAYRKWFGKGESSFCPRRIASANDR